MGVSAPVGAPGNVIQVKNSLDVEWYVFEIFDIRQIAARVSNFWELNDFAARYRHRP